VIAQRRRDPVGAPVSRPARGEFRDHAPADASVGGDFAPPQKGVLGDVRKAPPHQLTVRPGSELNDVVAFRAADHLQETLRDRIAPLHLPCIDTGVVDPQRRAPGVDIGRRIATPQFAARRNDPDILDRAAFQHPAEVPFALAPAHRAIAGKLRDVEVPGADETAVKIHLAAAVRRGTVGAKRIEKC
jgi:hypothetical protein